MTKHRLLLLRFVIASTAGMAAALIATGVVWLDIDPRTNVNSSKWTTQRTLHSVGEALHNYQDRMKSLPETLEGLRALDIYDVWFEPEESFVDGWQRPFEYTNDGTNYTVTSYGRDGKPGGIGLDHDLTSLTMYSAPSAPTFIQFLFDCYVGIVGTCELSGVLTFALCWDTVKPTELTRQRLLFLGARITITSLGAIFIASLLALFHIPTGH